MKRRGALLLCLISAVVLFLYVGEYIWEEYSSRSIIPVRAATKIMGISVVDNLDFLSDKQKGITEENPGVYFEKTLLPYSASENTLYLSQKIEEEKWQGTFSTDPDAVLCMLWDEGWENKASTIREGQTFTIWMVTEDTYYELSLVVSGMPVIEIATERMEEQEKVPYEVDPDKLYFDSEDLYYGNIRVFDSGGQDRGYEIVECNVRYHYKGATTANFEKKGYAISLQDARENNLDVSLLGMRADNSWKLNAMVTDDNRIREMTASQIWEQIDEANGSLNEAGPKMEYVELIVDNDYKGLYCLVEPVDEQKLQLDGNDYLYKTITWDAPTDADMQHAVNMNWRIMKAIRIRYPEIITDYPAAWYPIRDYINKIYYGYDGFQEIGQMVYPENAYDMIMFLMVVNGNDNYFKNIYYAADVASDRSYTMRMIPWDLDYTFGNVYSYEGKNYSAFDATTTYEYVEESFWFLQNYCPESVNEILLSNWYNYRESFLSTEAIQQLMIENRDYLVNTGVVARENLRWPQYSMDTDIDYLLDFQAERMDWLDGYFGGLAN